RVIGAVLRTRAGVKPLFVSPGHLIDVATAASLTLDCCPRYRLPEPLRAAHHLAATGAS
ncbi:MAG: endonuclease V, partial [Caldilineae bacterium]